MTVIDRAHRLVLILMVTTIPAIFLVDLIAEVVQRDITVSPGWQAYLAMVLVAGYQLRTQRWDADWIILGGGLGTALLGLMSHMGTQTVIDLTASILLVLIVGMVGVAVSRHAPLVTGAVLGLTSMALATVAFVEDGLKLDDIVTKSAAVAILFGLGGWALYQLRLAYEAHHAARDVFLAAVSHELRTPLTALAGFAEILASRPLAAADPEAAELAALMNDQAREAVDIVDDLLVAARSDIGQVTVAIAATDLSRQIEAVLESLRTRAEEQGKSIAISLDDAFVHADDLRLRQIVRNLVTNAIRYGGEHIEISAFRSGETGVVEVVDDGADFSSEDADAIFAVYGRSLRVEADPGSIGLGLTVSRQLARLMSGELDGFRRGQQTVFRLTLPIAEGHAAHV